MRINHLATWQKLLLLALPCLLLAAVPAALHLGDLQAGASRGVQGAAGARSAKTVLEVVRVMQQHRGLSNGVLSGNAGLVAQRDAKKVEVLAAIDSMVGVTPRASAALVAESNGIARAFAELATAVDARAIPVGQSFTRHTELIARLLAHLGDWLDHHRLTFEEDPVNHFLVTVTYAHLPALTEAMGQARAHGTAMLTTRTPTQRDRLFASALYDRAADRLAAARAGLTKAAQVEPGLRERLQAPLDRVEGETRRVVELARRELVDAQELAFDAAEYFALTTRAIDAQFQLLDQAAAELGARLQAGADAGVRARDLVILGGFGLLIVVSAFAYAITRAITRPLSRAVAVAGRIASGRLDNEIRPEGGDEVARLLVALHEMQAQLVQVVGRIQESGFSIREAAAQAAMGNSDLSSRTEEQASTLQQTAANMEELTATVRQNAESASAAISLAAKAVDEARRGGELVARVVATMGAIAEGSRQVREITDTIDAIAFQTNLLALNAAVEAARAGDHGRGFAVVASEVRSLAQRCAQASQQIRALIRESGEKVEEGRREADVAGAAVERFVASVGTVARRVNDIAAASAQQRAGIEQVNQAVTQMDSVTQQNAALVEEAASNALALEGQAAELAAAVEVFSTGRELAEARPEPGVQRGAKLARRTSLMRPAPSLPSTIS
jgi:methyl-accepting chemotaxis protein